MKPNKIHISIVIVLAGMTSHTVKITRVGELGLSVNM